MKRRPAVWMLGLLIATGLTFFLLVFLRNTLLSNCYPSDAAYSVSNAPCP